MKKTDIVYVLSALFLAVVTVVYFVHPDIDWDLLGGILYTVVPATIPIASFWLVRYHGLGSLQGKMWFAWGLSGLCDFIGESMDSLYYEYVVGEAAPWPGLPDIFWLSSYVFSGIFIALAVLCVKDLLKKRNIAMVVAIGILGCIPFIIYGMLPIFEWAAEATTMELAVSFAYPVMDFIIVFGTLLVFLVSRAFGGGRIAAAYLIVSLGFLFVVAADLWWIFLELGEGYESGHWVDLVYYPAYLLMALAPYYQRVVLKREMGRKT